MKLFLPLVLVVLNAHLAIAIEGANSVIKSVECHATKGKSVKWDDDTVATIQVSGTRSNPDLPLKINYTEEFWATSGNGPQHRIISFSDLVCSTLLYKTGASSNIRRKHYELSCSGETMSGDDALVRLDLDSILNSNLQEYIGYTGQTGDFQVRCSYEKF